MSAATLIRQAEGAGIELRLVDGKVKAIGQPEVLAAMVDELRGHKAEIALLLANAHETTVNLLAAAMRACDHHTDGPEAHEEMRHQCLATSPHLQADLLAHFLQNFPTNRAQMRLRDRASPSLRPSGSRRKL